MQERADQSQIESIASKVVKALVSHEQIPGFSEAHPGLEVVDAYRVTPLIRTAFESRGENILGRKIGFTNRNMWKVYGVGAPVWGYCTDKSTFELNETPVVRVRDFAEPRLEPEIIFGLSKAPHPSMDEAGLLDCIEWISLGYEVVQSIYPGWKYTAPTRLLQMLCTAI